MDIIEEIRIGLTRPGKSKSGLARALNRQPSAVTALLTAGKNGKARAIKASEVPIIRAYFKSDEPDEDFPLEEMDTPGDPTDGIREIDVRAGLGGGGSVDQNLAWHNGTQVDPLKAEAWKFPAPFVHNELRRSEDRIKIIETFGDSMSPTIQSGDRVIIDTDHVIPSPDGLYAVRDRYGSIVIKRLQSLRRGDPPVIRIISDNKAHDTEDVGADEITIVGRVLWGLKRL